ncbi:MAG: lamin tail domain-containing protein, partial [Planctomycetota bacterium]|nr:lamin tail domain-containing protein [Planctomycetota bacterium]
FLSMTSLELNTEPNSPSSLAGFIQTRRDFLLKHNEIQNSPLLAIQPRNPKPTTTNPVNAKIPLAINELCASNTLGIKDPENQREDWIELVNYGETTIDLTGLYLSDDPDNLDKWKFPDGTRLNRGGYLLIWADDDKTQTGLHANFKLAKQGEVLLLSNGVEITDQVKFGPQTDNVSWGRKTSSAEKPGTFFKLTPSPGKGDPGNQ